GQREAELHRARDVSMNRAYEEIDGFRCYAPKAALDEAGYPRDGFALTAEVEARSFWCRSRNRLIPRVFERFTDRSRPIEVLEIGCGTGSTMAALQKIPNLHCTGSEVSLQGLRYARSRVSDVVDLIQMDATDIPFHEAFDVVGAFDVMEHIEPDEL